MLASLQSLFRLFSKKEKKQLVFLLSVTTFNGLIQALGVLSVMPFIAVLTDPNLVETNFYLVQFRQWLPVSLQDAILPVLGLTAFCVLLLGNTLIIFDYWLTLRIFNRKEYQVSIGLLNSYLRQNLLDFRTRKISEMSKNVLSEVDRVVIGSMLSVVGIVSDGAIAISIIGLLLYVNFWVTVITSVVLLMAYAIVYLTVIRKIKMLGEQFSDAETRIFSGIKQILELFKEAKVAGKSRFFIRKYSKPAKTISRNATKYHLLKIFPEQIIEIFAFGLIIFIALYFSMSHSSSASVISTIAFFAFAMYRLTPVLKSIFDGVEEFQYLRDSLAHVTQDFELTRTKNLLIEPSDHRLQLEQAVSFDKVSFTYPGNLQPVFSNLSVKIIEGQFTCIIGPSGAGKSTLLDLLLGLIQPNSGTLKIGQECLLENNSRRWQANIGYVPQNIQLLEDTIASNIAFGVAKNNIDINRVKKVAQISGIEQFVLSNFSEGFEHVIGDGGQTMSGGQKQRIGIARSLYHNPQVLLLDEATNELDDATELHILTNLLNLKNKTIVFVSHKASVLKFASQVLEIKGAE